MVMCDNDECNAAPQVTGSTRKTALETWNRRAPDNAHDELVAALRWIVDKLDNPAFAGDTPDAGSPDAKWLEQARAALVKTTAETTNTTPNPKGS
jgi:hypothetical protein